MRERLEERGTVVDGVADRWGVVVVVARLELEEFEEFEPEPEFDDRAVVVVVARAVAPVDDGVDAPPVVANAALMAMPAPIVVAAPTLSTATARRLRAAGWGRRRRERPDGFGGMGLAMGSTLRIGWKDEVKGG